MFNSSHSEECFSYIRTESSMKRLVSLALFPLTIHPHENCTSSFSVTTFEVLKERQMHSEPPLSEASLP